MKPVYFHLNRTKEVRYLVERFHYSGTMPANTVFCGSWHHGGGLFGDYGPIVAACVIGIPACQWKEDIVELSRLVRIDGAMLPPLSGLISKTVRWCYRPSRSRNLIVSYADKQMDHFGGVYQASSWHFAALRGPQELGIYVYGQQMHGRTAVERYGTRSVPKLRQILGTDDVHPHVDEGKYLYWKAMNKSGRAKAKRLDLQSLPYPKPDVVAA